MLIRHPSRTVRSRLVDSTRWASYRPRADDVIMATYPKCGSTWVQRIVCMLVFRSAAPRPIRDFSPVLDARWGPSVEDTVASLEGQTHRRLIKAHLPYEALPVYEGAKFIHVARDGRDAAMSYHNHKLGFAPATVARINAINLKDPLAQDAAFPVSSDPAVFFHDWIENSGTGSPYASFFHVEHSFWAVRRDANMLFVHYNDLQQDRDGEMRRLAKFLDIEIPETLWPELVDAASFDAKVKTEFSPNLARWIEHGRLTAGNPRELPD